MQQLLCARAFGLLFHEVEGVAFPRVMRTPVNGCSAMHADGVEQQLLLRVPTNFSELRAVRRTLALYQKACPGQIAVLLLTFYLFLQVGLSSCIVTPLLLTLHVACTKTSVFTCMLKASHTPGVHDAGILLHERAGGLALWLCHSSANDSTSQHRRL